MLNLAPVSLLTVIIFQIRINKNPPKFDKAEEEIFISSFGIRMIFSTTLTIPETRNGAIVFLESPSDCEQKTQLEARQQGKIKTPK